jgi:membrane-associated two-gene conflict system component 1 (EACC1)
MGQPLEMAIRVDDASPEELAAITRELNRWITDNVPDVRSSLPDPGRPRPGDKGAEMVMGTLVLSLLNSAAVAGLVTCLQLYIKERRRSVKLEVKGAEGRSVSLAADNIGRPEMDDLLRRMGELAQVTEPAAT